MASEQKAVPTASPKPEVAQIPAAESAPAAERTPPAEPAAAAEPAPATEPALATSSASVDQPVPAVEADMPLEAFKAIVAHAREGLPQAVAGLANRGIPEKMSYDVTHPDALETPYTAVLTFSTRSDTAHNQSACLWTAKYAFQDRRWALTRLEWQTTSYRNKGNAAADNRRPRDVVELKKLVYPKGKDSTPRDDVVINLMKGQ